MKRLIILLLLTIFSNCNGSIFNIKTQTNSEINKALRSKLHDTYSTLLKALKSGNQVTIEQLLSSEITNNINYDFSSIAGQLIPLCKKYDFTMLDEYYTVVHNFGNEKKFTIIPAFAKEKLIINNLYFFNNESYNIFLITKKLGIQYLLFLSFSKYNNNWEPNIIHVGDYSINNLNASQMYEMALRIKESGRLASSGIYAIALNKVLRPAPFLQYQEEKKFLDFINSIMTELNDLYKFPLKLEKIQIIGLNIEIVEDEGILPVVLYITSVPLTKEMVEPEAFYLKKEIISTFSHIEKDFKYIIMSAYNESPIDKNKKYERYNTIIQIK